MPPPAHPRPDSFFFVLDERTPTFPTNTIVSNTKVRVAVQKLDRTGDGGHVCLSKEDHDSTMAHPTASMAQAQRDSAAARFFFLTGGFFGMRHHGDFNQQAPVLLLREPGAFCGHAWGSTKL